MNPHTRSVLRIVLLIVAVACFVAAWAVALGNEVFDSSNAGAFGYAGLAAFAASFLP